MRRRQRPAARARRRRRSRTRADVHRRGHRHRACRACPDHDVACGRAASARGTIRAVNGTYFAFGQKLTIDRGRLIFDGPLDNPALDVVALRKNLAVEAGVELTGTVKVPQVRVTSNPPVPENEALAWLVTGQGLNSSSRVDYAALSAASAALLGRNGKPITAQIAQRIGLDDISLKSKRRRAARRDGGIAGRRVRQADQRPAVARLRAGPVARDERACDSNMRCRARSRCAPKPAR